MSRRYAKVLYLASLSVFIPAHPAQGADANTSFRIIASYDRPGLPVPKWQFQIGSDGRAVYTSARAAKDAPASDSTLAFTFSRAGLQKLQKLLDDSNHLSPCETKAKGLARMGMKTFEYRQGDAPAAQCTFNYTDNKPLGAAADYLSAASFTIEQGATLDRLHRYDRLGLDPVMTQLATAYKEGHASELQAIRPTLQSLVSDDQVLDRVRQKAAQLLEQSDRD